MNDRNRIDLYGRRSASRASRRGMAAVVALLILACGCAPATAPTLVAGTAAAPTPGATTATAASTASVAPAATAPDPQATAPPGPAPTSTPQSLRTIPVTIGAHVLQVELAVTAEERATGLMFRQQLASDAGMLFVFPEDSTLAFWMRNTSIPLSIAFIDSHRRIIDIFDMQPLDETSLYSSAPARYALEVNQGWFSARSIRPGDLVTFDLPANLTVR